MANTMTIRRPRKGKKERAPLFLARRDELTIAETSNDGKINGDKHRRQT